MEYRYLIIVYYESLIRNKERTGGEIMTLIIRKTTIYDIEDLLPIQKASFKDDLEKYQDFETNPACETFEKLEENIQNIIILRF
jgi:hypothetical protein